MQATDTALKDSEPFEYSCDHGHFRSWLSGKVEQQIGGLWVRVDRGNPGLIGKLIKATKHLLTLLAIACLPQLPIIEPGDQSDKPMARTTRTTRIEHGEPL